jgi:hypothetical protein
MEVLTVRCTKCNALWDLAGELFLDYGCPTCRADFLRLHEANKEIESWDVLDLSVQFPNFSLVVNEDDLIEELEDATRINDGDIIGTLDCDRCNRSIDVQATEFTDEFYTEHDDREIMVDAAAKAGFVRYKDTDGDDWDLCGMCAKSFAEIQKHIKGVEQDFLSDHIKDADSYQLKIIGNIKDDERFEDMCTDCSELDDGECTDEDHALCAAEYLRKLYKSQ